jgi:hypothetical protein
MTTHIPDDLDGEIVIPGLTAAAHRRRSRAAIRGELSWLAANARAQRTALREGLARRVVLWAQLVWPPKVRL